MTRVVITGMGVIAPNAHGLKNYEQALREGKSGLRHYEKLQELKFGCQVAGVPQGVDELSAKYFSKEALMAMNSNMIYAAIAGIDCWVDSGFSIPEPGDETVDWETGAIIGTGIGGLDTAGEKLVPGTDAGKTRRLGSTIVEQIMSSSVSARLTGFMGLGGQVTTNSSACTTGTEAIIDAFHKVRSGQFKRMLAGGSEGSSHYIWAGFDAMRVLNRGHNETPEQASRPMSASAGGFIPGSGAGVLMVESLYSAQERGARIYAEILGGQVNCGGQRNGGTMTAPNPEGVQRCIKGAMQVADIQPQQIDAISGHLTATMADPQEVNNWCQALDTTPDKFPVINATKSLIGHGLGAAGGLECVAAVLQLEKGFMHGSLNCEDLHPELEVYANSIPHQTKDLDINIMAKASFGFGDVNGCVIFKKWGT